MHVHEFVGHRFWLVRHAMGSIFCNHLILRITPLLSFVMFFDMHTNRKIEHCHAYHFLEINLHRNLILMMLSDCL